MKLTGSTLFPLNANPLSEGQYQNQALNIQWGGAASPRASDVTNETSSSVASASSISDRDVERAESTSYNPDDDLWASDIELVEDEETAGQVSAWENDSLVDGTESAEDSFDFDEDDVMPLFEARDSFDEDMEDDGVIVQPNAMLPILQQQILIDDYEEASTEEETVELHPVRRRRLNEDFSGDA